MHPLQTFVPVHRASLAALLRQLPHQTMYAVEQTSVYLAVRPCPSFAPPYSVVLDRVDPVHFLYPVLPSSRMAAQAY